MKKPIKKKPAKKPKPLSPTQAARKLRDTEALLQRILDEMWRFKAAAAVGSMHHTCGVIGALEEAERIYRQRWPRRAA